MKFSAVVIGGNWPGTRKAAGADNSCYSTKVVDFKHFQIFISFFINFDMCCVAPVGRTHLPQDETGLSQEGIALEECPFALCSEKRTSLEKKSQKTRTQSAGIPMPNFRMLARLPLSTPPKTHSNLNTTLISNV